MPKNQSMGVLETELEPGSREDDGSPETVVSTKTSRQTRKKILVLVLSVPPLLLILMLGDSLFQWGNSGKASNANVDNSIRLENGIDGIGKMPQGMIMPENKNQKNVPQSVQEKRRHDVCFLKAAYGPDANHIEWPPNVTAIEQEHHPRVKFFLYTNKPQAANQKTHGWQVVRRTFPYERWKTHHAWPRLMAWKESRIYYECQVAIFVTDVNKLPKSDKMEEFFNFAAKLYSAGDAETAWAMDPLKDDKATLADQLDPASEFNQLRQTNKAGNNATYTKKLFNATSEWLTNHTDFSPSTCTIYDESMIAYSLQSTKYKQMSQFFWNEYREERLIDLEGPLWCYTVHHFHAQPASLSPIRDLFYYA